MTVYYGVVKGKRIELEGDVQLAEGTRVEVHPRPSEAPKRTGAADCTRSATGISQEEAETESSFKERLRAEGRLAPAPRDAMPAPHARRLIDVQGQPLSEQIIAERR